MNKFRKPHGSNRGGGGFGGGDRGAKPRFGGGAPRPSFGRRDGGERAPMFDAVCAQCGKPCQVPFKPNGKKPIYCSNCFAIQRGEAAPSASSGRDSFPRRDDRGGSPRPFMPHGDRPAFSPRTERPAMQASAPHNNDREIAALQRQMDVVTSKLDAILRMLEGGTRANVAAPVAPAAAKSVISAAVSPVMLPVAPEPKKMLLKAIPKKKLAVTKKKGPAKK